MIKDKKNATILIADDSITNSLLIKGILESEGFKNAQAVHNGRDALKIIKQASFDAIILDIKMPNNITGIDILKQLKSNINTQNIPIIIISANNNQQEIEMCYKLGIYSYLHKPLNIQMFTEIIHNLFK